MAIERIWYEYILKESLSMVPRPTTTTSGYQSMLSTHTERMVLKERINRRCLSVITVSKRTTCSWYTDITTYQYIVKSLSIRHTIVRICNGACLWERSQNVSMVCMMLVCLRAVSERTTCTIYQYIVMVSPLPCSGVMICSKCPLTIPGRRSILAPSFRRHPASN